MKKTIISGMLAIAFMVGVPAHAQTVPMTTEQRSALISILERLIELLQQEILLMQNQAVQVGIPSGTSTPTQPNLGGNFLPAPVITSNPKPMQSISVETKIGASIGTSGIVGQVINLTPKIQGAGAFPQIHVTTNAPDGFYRFNGAIGGESEKTNDQTFEISAEGGSGAITAEATEPGDFEFVFSLVSDPTISTTVNVHID